MMQQDLFDEAESPKPAPDYAEKYANPIQASGCDLNSKGDNSPADPLAIPDFLRRFGGEKAKPLAERPLTMPPKALVPVLRTVGRGADTWQKLAKRLGKRYTEAEIREALTRVVDNGEVIRTGRRYTLAREKLP